MGWCRACQVLTLTSVVPVGTRRRGGSYGSFGRLLCWNWGTPTPLEPTVVGHENASVREGGRRWRSSQTPECNAVDTVKDHQVWCTETTEQTRTWGMFPMGTHNDSKHHSTPTLVLPRTLWGG